MVEINLGVVVEAVTIAAIAKSILAKLAAGAVSHWLAVRETAEEFHEMQRMKEAGLRQLSTLLAQGSDIAEWEWFQMLKNMSEYGLLTPENGDPPTEPPTGLLSQPWMSFVIVGALVFSIVFLLRK